MVDGHLTDARVVETRKSIFFSFWLLHRATRPEPLTRTSNPPTHTRAHPPQDPATTVAPKVHTHPDTPGTAREPAVPLPCPWAGTSSDRSTALAERRSGADNPMSRARGCPARFPTLCTPLTASGESSAHEGARFIKFKVCSPTMAILHGTGYRYRPGMKRVQLSVDTQIVQYIRSRARCRSEREVTSLLLHS